jgi:hypothetical protein
MLTGDPRADPRVVDLIELAGLWLGADDRIALERTLRQLVGELDERFAQDASFRDRWLRLLEAAADARTPPEELRRQYRRASLG